MPDIRPANRYISRMRKLDVAYFMRVKNALTDFRKTALDILYRDGVKITTIPVIRKESDWLSRRIENIGSEQATKIDDVALWYMGLELETLKTVGERQAPTVDALNIQTFSERKEIQQNTILKKPAWVENMIQNIEINMTKLSVADATVEQAVDRLLSIKIADGRASVYRLAGVAAEQHVKNVSWSAASIIMAGMFKAVQVQTMTVYKKQAIAAIDQNTTDCCLRVHGQIQPLDKPFILEGTPRYADKVDAPPFHWNCRSAMSLYTEKMEAKGVPTAEMEAAARAELEAREQTGMREKIWPASATSRRE